MTSTLVAGLLDKAGLFTVLATREGGREPTGSAVDELLARADILALGAAADIARRNECGVEARIYVPRAPAPSDKIAVVGREEPARGTALLRRIATMRLLGPIGLAIVVDFGSVGLEIAQVALSFGATDLAGPIASRRGLPMIVDDQKKAIKRRTIAGFVERAGFRALFIDIENGGPAEGGAGLVSSTRDHVQS